MKVDAIIFGGGVAGLWLLDDLTRQGYCALLLEANALGSGQTIGSQGIVHGGLKYSLHGILSESARRIKEMPEIWRDCLSGKSEPDLSSTVLRAEKCYLWQPDGLVYSAFMGLARLALNARPEKIEPAALPHIFKGCSGSVYALPEQVIEPASLLEQFLKFHRAHILKYDRSALKLEIDHQKIVVRIRDVLDRELELESAHAIFCAGAGNAELRKQCGLSPQIMQRRPLHMAVVRGDLPELNGHCIDNAMRTKLTITTSRYGSSSNVWQIGGQIAEDGVSMSPAELILHTQKELHAALPDLSLKDVEWMTYRVDRAEPAMGGKRPDDAWCRQDGCTITAWPTKLALAPRLSALIRERLARPQDLSFDATALAALERPAVASYPWLDTNRSVEQ